MATIKDVAERCGLSKTLVSRCLNNQKGVGPESRRRIMAAVEELNYRPNAIARSLVLRQTGMLGVVMDDLCSPFFFPVIQGIEAGARGLGKGYDVVFCSGGGDPARKQQQISRLTQGSVDGLIVYGSFVSDDAIIRQLGQTGFPFVLIENDIAVPDIEKVLIDNRQGAKAAVELLIRQGHRRIVHIGGNLNWKITTDRMQGYCDAMRANDLPIDPGMTRFPDFTGLPVRQEVAYGISYKEEFFQCGYAEAKRLLAEGELPEAIFFATDMAAFGAWKAFREAGVRVPEDISLVGFDDENPAFCGYDCPAVTTVRQPLRRAGATAAERLIALIEQPEIGRRQTMLPTELVLRNSSRPR